MTAPNDDASAVAAARGIGDHESKPAHSASLADRTMSCISGGTDAQRLLQILRAGMAPADALHEALQLELATGDAERLRGFARELQKSLERALGVA